MEYLRVLLPSIVVGLLFWYVLRAIIKSDSTERKEMDRYYAEMEVHKAQQEKSAGPRHEPEAIGEDPDNGSQSEDDSHR